MNARREGFSGRQIGAFLALWLGWSLAFGLAQTGIDALIASRMPHGGFALAIFALALGAVWLGTRLWPAWRGALGLIAVVFALFAGLVGLLRRAPDPESLAVARPVTSPLALTVSVLGSVVAGAVLLHAEKSRRGRLSGA
jgi:hypothetical protein